LSDQIEKDNEITIVCDDLKKLIASKNYNTALKKVDEYLLTHQGDENLLNDKGVILTKLGRFQEAIDYFKEALKISKKKDTKGIIWNNKGLAHCNKKEFYQAIRCFRESYGNKGKDYTNALNNEGLANYYIGKNEINQQEKEKRFKEAIKLFDNVIELDKKNSNEKNSNAYNNKGSSLIELGWYEEAKRCIDKAIELDANNANAWNNRGRILANSSNYQEAINYYNKAIEITKGNHRESWNNKGIAIANLAKLTDEQKYFSEAERCYDKAKKIDNAFVNALNNKAMLYVNTHNFVKAEEIIDESLKISEENKEENVDTMDKKGIILLHLEQYDEALSWFKKATKKNPENKISRYHMGNVYMKLKKYDEAIECFDDSLKDNLNFAEAHNGKASALFNKGNQKEAAKEVKRAIEIKPSLAVANENIAKLTSSGSQNFQNFWDFWKSSIFKKIVGIMLFALLLGTTVSITYHIVSNIILFSISSNNPTNTTDIPVNTTNTITNTTNETELIDISEGYFITLAIILFILLIPEIKKAKMGPMEFELQEQHIHPTNESSSMSEEHQFSPLLSN
jgi:tetratricopeptide (TPR) repeat protein